MNRTSRSVTEFPLKALSAKIASEVGLNFPEERFDDLNRVLFKAAQDSGIDDPNIMASKILDEPLDGPVFQDLVMRLTIGETHFFRDEKLFKALESEILPGLMAAKRLTGEKLRIWSAGCSTGEEPYSIAMLLKRALPHMNPSEVTLAATDINGQSLEKAMEGKYSQWSFRGAPEWIKERFFTSDDQGNYLICEEIKSMVTFGRHNLAKDPFPPPDFGPGPMDLIFCRNVLMYFTREKLDQVTLKFGKSLSKQGGVFVAPAEAEQALGPDLRATNVDGVIVYRKISDFPVTNDDRGTRPAPLAPKEILLPVKRKPPLSMINVPSALTNRLAMGSPGDRPIKNHPHDGGHGNSELKRGPINGKSPKEPDPINALPGYERMVGVARSLANQGELEQARQWLEKAIESDKLDPKKHYLMGTILQELGLFQEASEYMRHVVYLAPETVLAHFSLGSLCKRLGRSKEAQRHFDNALKALEDYGDDDVVSESDGMTAGNLVQMIIGLKGRG